MDRLNTAAIKQAMQTQLIGQELDVQGEVDSTSAALLRRTKAGALEGTVVIADSQTAGQGRMGKPWFSPPGVNLYLSVLLKPPFHIREAHYFAFQAKGRLPLLNEWRKRSSLGSRVSVHVEGIAKDIDDEGCLLVTLDDGQPCVSAMEKCCRCHGQIHRNKTTASSFFHFQESERKTSHVSYYTVRQETCEIFPFINFTTLRRCKMSLHKFCQRPVVTISPEENVLAACKLLKNESIGCVVAVDNGKLSGILTDRDIALNITGANKDPEKLKVREVIRPSPCLFP